MGHKAGAAVTCLALSVNAGQLISGGEDKQVCIFDVTSRQLIKTITQLGAITNLHLRLISGSKFHPGPKEPKFFADSLKRMISPEDENYCIELLITEVYPKARKLPKFKFDMCSLDAAPTDENVEENVDEMADATNGTSNNKSVHKELERLRAENAQLKLEAKRLLELKTEAIVTNPKNRQHKKKVKMGNKKKMK